MTKMVCMCTDPNSTDVLIGGHTKTVTKYDLGKQKVVNEIVLGDAGCVIIRETSSLCCFGKLSRDPVIFFSLLISNIFRDFKLSFRYQRFHIILYRVRKYGYTYLKSRQMAVKTLIASLDEI